MSYTITYTDGSSFIARNESIDGAPPLKCEDIASLILSRDYESVDRVTFQRYMPVADVTREVALRVRRQADERGWISPEVAIWCEANGAKIWHTTAVED